MQKVQCNLETTKRGSCVSFSVLLKINYQRMRSDMMDEWILPPSCQISNVITSRCAPWFHRPKPFPQKLGIGGGGWWCIWFGLATDGNLWRSPPWCCLSKEDTRIISGSRSKISNIRSKHQHEKVLHEKLSVTEESYESRYTHTHTQPAPWGQNRVKQSKFASTREKHKQSGHGKSARTNSHLGQ